MAGFHRVALLAAALVLTACDGMPRLDPPPLAEIALAVDGGFLLDGRPLDSDRLDRELMRRASEARSEKTGRTRLQVRITTAPNTDYSRVTSLQERCLGLGISQIEVAR